MKQLRFAVLLSLAVLVTAALAAPPLPKQPAGSNMPSIPGYQNGSPLPQQNVARDVHKRGDSKAPMHKRAVSRNAARQQNLALKTAALAPKNVIAPQFKMNTDSLLVNLYRNEVAAGMQEDGTIISVWTDSRSGNNGVYFQRLTMQGTPLGEVVAVDHRIRNSYQWGPGIGVAANGNFAIAWCDYLGGSYYNIYCRLFDSSGNPLDTAFRVDDCDGTNHYYPEVAATDSGFIVAWTDYRSGTWDIYLQMLDTMGGLKGPNVLVNSVTTNDQYYPAISGTNLGFVVSWWDTRNGNEAIYARMYNANGDTTGTDFMVNDNTTSSRSVPEVCNTDSGFVITWYDYRNSVWDIYLQRYDTTGAAVGANYRVTDGSANSYLPTIAHNNGQTAITWHDTRNGNNDIFAQWFKPNGDTLGGQIKLNDDITPYNQNYPKAMASDSGWAFIWIDPRNDGTQLIYGQCYDTSLAARGPNIYACDSTFGMHEQYDPSVAAGQDGNFLSVWYDYRLDGGSWNICDIFGRLYDKDGNALTPDFLISDTAYNSSDRYAYDPKAACLADGSYMVAWYDYRNDNDYDIIGQRLNASGSPVGGNYLISTNNQGSEDYNSAIAANDSGYGVFWYGYKYSYSDIFGRLYRTNGDSIGSTMVLTDTINYHYAYYPCVAVNDSGLEVVWEDYLDAYSYYYICGQQVKWDGILAGGNTIIGDTVDADQYEPSIAGRNSGFLATWYDYRNGNDAIFGQYLDAVGQKVDTNFLISTDAANYQYDPSVAVSPDGNRYAVFWYSESSGSGVEWLTSQRYLGGLPQGVNETVVDSLGWNWLYTWGASNIAASEDRLFFTFYGQNGYTGSDVFGKITDWYSVSEPPSGVAQVFPPHDTLLGYNTVDFSWTNATPGTYALGGYRLQVSADSTMSSYCLDTLISDTSITVALSTSDTMYYWRVRAVDIYDYQGPVTTIRNFEIDVTDPAIPTLISPVDNHWLGDTAVGFVWDQVVKKVKASEVSYVIQIDTSNTFASPLIEDTTVVSLDTFNLSEGQYYWRVMAYDAAGNYGTYSVSRTFGVDTTAPDIQYVLALGDDAAAPYGPYEVTSKVYDLSGVKAAWLFRQINGGSWDSTAMFFASDSLRDSIPELTPATDETLSVSYYIRAIDMVDHVTTSSTYSFKAIGPLGVAGYPGSLVPEVFALNGAYPNPSRGNTVFKYQLPKASDVRLDIYNVAGQLIKSFDQGTRPAGYHQIQWNGQIANGVYIYRLKAGSLTFTKKMMIVR
jgi:hypothetical protein